MPAPSMPASPRPLELLAPAANVEIAREAILHGADAVYIGASSHGARKAAANSVNDIRALVEFAHIYRAKVYVTVNTIVYEPEIPQVEKLIWDLYAAGVDAIIVQDMGILRMRIPPIALHASTQCDNRTPEKVEFLQRVGFSQVVLARELSLKEIQAICDVATVPVECFVHGALCVSYSGRCHASYSISGRSANRGECSQVCRLRYRLTDASGAEVAPPAHFLSLKDFNASGQIHRLIEAGVSSFKIEGRLKEADYVKNVTAAYRRIIDDVIARHPDKYCRSSFGESRIAFSPKLEKSFNRGFTTYFLNQRRPQAIASLRTPKSLGEPVADVSELHNGDGISFFDAHGEYQGVNINRVVGRRLITARPVEIPRDARIFRTYDRLWQQELAKARASRKLKVDITLTSRWLSATDERGVSALVALDAPVEHSEKTFDYAPLLSKLGNTPYEAAKVVQDLPEGSFIPASMLTDARRRLIDALSKANLDTYHFDMRRPEDMSAKYPASRLDYRDNVANTLAEQFYREHGVGEIEPAAEAGHKLSSGDVVMTTRHCILRELGICKKTPAFAKCKIKEPLAITSGPNAFTLRFDCSRCEMQLLRSN